MELDGKSANKILALCYGVEGPNLDPKIKRECSLTKRKKDISPTHLAFELNSMGNQAIAIRRREKSVHST